MGVTETFSFLATLPPAQRLPYVEAALREPYVDLQQAAFEALSDPAGLNRLDVVIYHYGDLSSDVKARVAARAPQFREAARQALASPREWSRRAAYQVLAALDPRQAPAILVRGLSDTSPVVRESIADALEAVANRYYYHLVSARMHGDPESRRYLDEHRPVMMESLGALLRSFHLHSKRIFLDIVIESGDDAFPVLADVLQSRTEPATYAAFIHALSTAVTEPAVELIFRLWLDDRPRLADAAADAMRLRRDPGFPALVATVISRMAPERLEALARRTREILWWHTVESGPEIDPLTAAKLMDFVVRTGLDEARKGACLLRFRTSSHAEVRARLLSALQAAGQPGVLETATAFLQDPADEVKLAAARTVAALDPPHKARLLAPLLSSGSDEVRRMAMREVANAGFEKYLRSFDRLDSETREAAARALAKIDGRIVERLAEEITALDPERRLRALRVIDFVDAETDLRQNLMALLNDPDRRVRATAIKIVELSGSLEGMRLLVAALGDEDRRVRANAIEAFEDGGDARTAPLLVPFLRDPDNRIRANAAKALWAFGRDEGRAALRAMLRDPDESMRLSAVWAIGESGFPGALELLAERTESESSPAVRTRILEVLARGTQKEAEAT